MASKIDSALDKFFQLKNSLTEFIAKHEGFFDLYFGGMELNQHSTEAMELIGPYKELRNQMSHLIGEIHRLSGNFDFYFFDCPLEVYKKTLHNRYQVFKDSFTEATHLEFYENELLLLKNPNSHRILYIKGKSVNYAGYIGDNDLNFSYSLKNKLRYIQKLLEDKIPPKTVLGANPIFKGLKGSEIFQYLLERFELDEMNINERGGQAKLMAIWEVKDARKTIFKESTALIHYINYLNNRYGLNISTKSQSSGNNYHLSVEKWISEYSTG